MSTHHQLWYVRHGDSVVGPFPPKVISRHVLLGRILPTDHVSPDQVNWLLLSECPELLPDEALRAADASTPEARAWHEERTKATRRWAEERLSPEPVHLEAERRHAGQSFEDMAFRQHHAEVQESLKKGRPRFIGAALAFTGFAIAVIMATMLYKPVNPVKVGLTAPTPDCAGKAAPEVNWSGCDKQGAWLAGTNLSYAKLPDADLSFANLSGVKLVSADLQNADLSHAELHGADLRYADLRGANLLDAGLQGAALDYATWSDGRVCKTGSLGQCL